MDVLVYLIPISLSLGMLGLVAFMWTLRSRQYEDPDGDSARILRHDYDAEPAPEPAKARPAPEAKP
jgi:cbb3-type cytochrome oxidase maturation protein